MRIIPKNKSEKFYGSLVKITIPAWMDVLRRPSIKNSDVEISESLSITNNPPMNEDLAKADADARFRRRIFGF